MEVNTLVILVCVASLVFGVGLGFLMKRISEARNNKKIINNAIEVMQGKRKNSMNIDGKEYDARKFVTRGEDGKETIIDLQGGVEEQNGKEEIKEIGEVSEEVPINPLVVKDSPSIGKRKRNLRRINGRRISRFG